MKQLGFARWPRRFRVLSRTRFWMRVLLICGIGFALAVFLFLMKQKTKITNPHITVRKSARELEVRDGDELIRSFKVALGSSPSGDKSIEGDGRTPVGTFYIFTRNPASKYHLSLGLSYPNTEDAERGLASGLISQAEYEAVVQAIGEKRMPPQKTRLGGEIYIHGGGTNGDWTEGCIALDNEDIAELFEMIPVGALVEILE